MRKPTFRESVEKMKPVTYGEVAMEVVTLTLLGIAFVAAHYTAYAFGW